MNEISNIRSRFEAMANPLEAEAMQAYMKDHFIYFGIKSTPRKEATKDILTELRKKPDIDWSFVFECFEQEEREFQYVATDYLRKVQRRFTIEDIGKLKSLILSKSWWDTVDTLAIEVGSIIMKSPSEQAQLNDWINDPNMWIRRVSIIHQLRFKTETNLEFLDKAISQNLGSKEFFINKAIGWALRSYGDTNPRWVVEYANNQNLASLSKKEALRKINIG